MTGHNKKERDVVDATGREIAKLDGERVQAERDVGVATTVERARAEAKLGQVKGALADAHGRLQAQLGAIVQNADTEIATVASKAKAASGPATAHLKARRDALVAK